VAPAPLTRRKPAPQPKTAEKRKANSRQVQPLTSALCGCGCVGGEC